MLMRGSDHEVPTRVGSSRVRRCVLARVCAGLRGAPRSTERTAGAGERTALYRGGGVRRGSVPGVSCLKTASPQMKSVTPTHKVEIRPRAGQSSALPARPEGKRKQNPKTRKEPQNPSTSAGARAGSSTGRVEWEAERGKKPSPKCVLNRSGGEGGKLRWLPAGLSSSAQPGQQFS